MAQPLKDMVDEAVVDDLATRIVAVASDFDGDAFSADLAEQLPHLELKPRIAAIARRMAAGLDHDYPRALATIVRVASATPAISGFAAWPLCSFVEIYGLDHPDASLAAMEHLTQRASCEFAVRPYLDRHWDAAYATLERFTAHEHEDVRRLSSEGTRPRLPWGMRVQRLLDDPRPGLALLGRLRHDPSETVRRSVANHLNDISKDHPDLAVETVQDWAGEEPPVDPRLLSHALRTLVKKGHPEALATLGYTTEASIEVVDFDVTPRTVVMGDRIALTAAIRSTAPKWQRLAIDFVVHHVNATGGTSPKVFKWAKVDMAPGEERTLTKRRLIQMASTRTYHSGPHRVELQIAGQVVAEATFDVSV